MQEIIKTREKLETIKKEVTSKIEELNILELDVKQQKKSIQQIAETLDKKISNFIEKDKFMNFFEKPYAVIPFRSYVLVVVPKFVKGFQVGWLWKETDNFFIYQVNQYSKWLGDVPKDLLEYVETEGINTEIIDENLYFNPSDKEKVKKKFGKHLTQFTENSARITRGHEFSLIVDIISSGNLPFKPKKVSEADMREPKGKIELRNYQKPAFDKFIETGAIGLFHPTGAGKSFISLKILDVIKGKKLIVVPTRSLVEQWHYYIDEHLSHIKNEITIITYQGYRNSSSEEYALAIFDECQKLPANTFSRLALINTKYRIGLSASPHREDGRESYIFALTGFPVGLNWEEYMKTTGRKYHPINVYVVNTPNQKEKKVEELLNKNKKTFIFSDSLDLGRRIATKLQVPFIFGETKERLDLIKEHPIVVISRVGDLGLSIKDLQHIIEVDFLFGSRQQELQRTGRLMHSEEKNVKHDIIMTKEEIETYGKRLWSLQEKGFSIKIIEDEKYGRG